jgi:hypothetical protein
MAAVTSRNHFSWRHYNLCKSFLLTSLQVMQMYEIKTGHRTSLGPDSTGLCILIPPPRGNHTSQELQYIILQPAHLYCSGSYSLSFFGTEFNIIHILPGESLSPVPVKYEYFICINTAPPYWNAMDNGRICESKIVKWNHIKIYCSKIILYTQWNFSERPPL